MKLPKVPKAPSPLTTDKKGRSLGVVLYEAGLLLDEEVKINHFPNVGTMEVSSC